jgi:hypothetical protein
MIDWAEQRREIKMPTNVTFSSDDSQRLATLASEIQSQLDKMVAIIAKAKGVPVMDDAKAKFVPRKNETHFSGMHIEILDDVKGQTCCVVWNDWPNGPAILLCPCA